MGGWVVCWLSGWLVRGDQVVNWLMTNGLMNKWVNRCMVRWVVGCVNG